MAKNQKSYTPEFKQQIVDLHCKAGKGVTELSNEYGIPKGTVSTWIKNDIVNIGLHFILKNVRPYAASCSEA